MTKIQTLPTPSAEFKNLAAFNRTLNFAIIPEEVTRTAKLLILDLIGVAAAASKLEAGRIARNHAVKHWANAEGTPGARLLFDGRSTSLPGFGFAMATQIDSLDAHDGWQPSKGHAGAALFPALCAFAEAENQVSGQEALLAMVLGYELSYRAAFALHATVTDYHTSGAWNSLGCAAIGARLRKLDDNQLRHALGIAEYHGPRSQMMREIANPSMLHDGTGWGAPTGIYAVLVAQDGFTGAPAATVEFDDAAFVWKYLGKDWLTTKQYIKPYPICRWAHAPIDAVLGLRRQHNLTADMIESVEVQTFSYSAELNADVPDTTALAQYSLAWPVAAALVRGRVGVNEVLESSFSDPELIKLTRKVRAVTNAQIETTFPEQRTANVIITLKDGSILESGITAASGGPDPQPTEQEVVEKYRAFAGSVLPDQLKHEIEKQVMSLDQDGSDFKTLLDVLTKAVS